MRVCLASREVAPFWGAGIGTYISQMAGAWIAGGHETHILTAPHPGVLRDGPRFRPGAHFHTVRTPREPGDTRYPFQVYAAAVYDALVRLHADHPFDYIEFPDYWAEGHAAICRSDRAGLETAVLGVRLHTPTTEARAFNAEPVPAGELALLQAAEDAAILSADLVASPTRSLLDIVSGRLGPCGRVRAVIPYPFDLTCPEELGGSAGVPAGSSDRPVVLYFGRLERRKGVEVLIAAAQRLLDSGSPAHFRLVGADTATGPGGSSMRAYLQSQIAERWRSRFIFDEPVPRARLGWAVREAITTGGLCCFPSLWENFPNACVEAMALGAPVVGSDAGGMAEIIRDGVSGVLFHSGSESSLQEALRRVLDDAELRSRIAAAARPRIAAICDPASIVRQMCAAFERARALSRPIAAGGPP